jgi:hypothetical protein
MKQVPDWWTADIRRHSAKFSRHGTPVVDRGVGKPFGKKQKPGHLIILGGVGR